MACYRSFLAAAIAATVFTAGCQGDFGRFPLADGLSVSATGQQTYLPVPLGEDGVHYRYIGVGWMAYDHRSATWHLWQEDQELATAPSEGAFGWRLGPAGREKAKQAGWSLSGDSKTGTPFLVGCAALDEAQAATAPATQPVTRPARPTKAQYDPLKHWTLLLQPRRKIGGPCDRVVFLCDARRELYVRVTAFDSRQYQFVGSEVSVENGPQAVGYTVRFRLRDRKTEKLQVGTYRYIWWRPKQEVAISEVK